MIAHTARAVCLMFLLLAGSLAGGGCRRQADGSAETKPSPGRSAPTVIINGRAWHVELAVTAEKRYRGLSGRTHLPANSGMLFIFPAPRVLVFCMRGCMIPLDIAFIGPDLRVVATETMAIEQDLAGRVRYSSSVPAQFALEVPAGSLRQTDVKIGDKVIFKGDIQKPAKAATDP